LAAGEIGQTGHQHLQHQLVGPSGRAAQRQIGLREQADGGKPTVAADPDGPVAGIYRDIARHAAAGVWGLGLVAAPAISMAED